MPRALDIDMVMIHGYGYPAWRGGPMFEADEIGTAEILADMREVHAAFGFGWEPAPLLVELGEAGRRFGELPPCASDLQVTARGRAAASLTALTRRADCTTQTPCHRDRRAP